MSTQQDQTVFTLPVTQLVADVRYQPRDSLNEAHVRLLVASNPGTWPPLLVSNPGTWPPLLVSPTEDRRFCVIDGFHRLEAAKRLKLFALPCVVELDAGYPEAFAANLHHGLALTLAERKAFARWLHKRDPRLSYREIGRRTGLSDKTVKRALTEDERADNPRPAPDPVARFVGQVTRLVDRGDIDVRALQREIAAYDDAWQGDIAADLDAVGRACVAAAAPYLGEG